ncbi:uncharacterized protein LOC126667659 isoform X2 [Mercurialis annua]|uniref:uncharacterized protein LOC126667659 isoform X2 n=1 Tax=Mercurialis annua TaxID=3986 RepID=UPI00215E96AA|nr:uncharacterized protein LOC126667659 isoform X2 [Mercurialis annua]
MVTFHIEKPSLLDNEEEALKENCNLESPALSFDAFNNQQKRRLRYNVADLFVKANKTPKLIVDVHENDILKVEILILRALDYNLRSVTALCFRSYFESLVAEPNVKPNVKEIIVQSHGDIRLARYNPSVIAASAVLASYYKDPACLQALLQGRVHLDENTVDYCARLIFDMCNQKLIPFLERNIVAGETSAEKPRKSSSSDTEEEQAEALLDTEEDHAEPLPHRPGKEPMFKEETGTNAFKIMADLMGKAREHKKRENKIDVSKVMADVVKEAGQSKEEKKIKSCEKVMEEFKLELKWMMGVKEEELILDPSQFPNAYESDPKQKSKGGKMKFILSKFKCCVKIDKDKQD